MEIQKFIYGTVYLIRKDRDIVQIQRDVENMAKMNFNTITLWPCGHWDEKKKKLDFSLVNMVIDFCAEYDIAVILELMGQACSSEYAPDWMVKDELWPLDQNGNRLTENVHDLNFNSPDVEKMIFNYIEEVARHFKSKKNIYAYDIYNEFHFRSYDKYTMDKFRQWLKKKYRDIAILNKAWNRTFSDWTQVFLEYRFWLGLMPSVDWHMFRYENFQRILRKWVSKLREIDNTRPIIADVDRSMIHRDRDCVIRGVDDWRLAKEVDRLGISWYPKSAEYNYPWYWCLMFSGIDSATGDLSFLLSELQTHHYSAMRTKGYTTPEELELWILQSIAYGAKGVTFWRWLPFDRGQQITGRGLCSLTGKITERALITKKIGRVLESNERLFLESVLLSQKVGIYYDLLNKTFVDFLGKGLQDGIIERSIYGYYHALWKENIHARFLNAEDIKKGKLKLFEVFYVPFNLVLDVDVARKIKNFVASGGTLIAQTRIAAIKGNDYTYEIIPGGGLDEVLGCKEESITVSEKDECIKFEESELLPNSLKGREFQAGYYKQLLLPSEKSETIASFKDGRPAVVYNKYGDGESFYIATSLGEIYNQSEDEAIKDFVVEIYKRKKINYSLEIGGKVSDDLDFLLHKSGETLLLFALNYGKRDEFANIKISGINKEPRVRELLSRRIVSWKREDLCIVFPIELNSGAVKIFKIM